MSSTAERRAFKLGSSAFHEGQAMVHNPFSQPLEADDWQAWREGWLSAKIVDDAFANDARKYGEKS